MSSFVGADTAAPNRQGLIVLTKPIFSVLKGLYASPEAGRQQERHYSFPELMRPPYSSVTRPIDPIKHGPLPSKGCVDEAALCATEAGLLISAPLLLSMQCIVLEAR